MKFVILALLVALACVSAIPAGEQDSQNGSGATCTYPEGLKDAAQAFVDAIESEY